MLSKPILCIALIAAFVLSGAYTAKTDGVTQGTSDSNGLGSPGCKAPNISHLRLVYEEDPTKAIEPEETVPNASAIIYQCKAGYALEGSRFNLCFNSEWNKQHPNCMKYCPAQILNGVTFKAQCVFNGNIVECNERIKPGTVARLSCRVGYKKPENANAKDFVACSEDGYWDYEPTRCEAICGEKPVQTTQFISMGASVETNEIPWHAVIYKNLSSDGYKYYCGGTIISPKVVVSAAHCFWDMANEMLFDKSSYLVGAGKHYHAYDAQEIHAQFQNISEIAIPLTYTGNGVGDIAVLVLNNFLILNRYIAPVCIKWENGADKTIESNIHGIVPGFGHHKTELRAVDMPTSSYYDCKSELELPFASLLTSDKFCVLNENPSDQIICQGDSGGGFALKKVIKNGKNVYHLSGVISGAFPLQVFDCQGYKVFTHTNIQYYSDLIISKTVSNRPK